MAFQIPFHALFIVKDELYNMVFLLVGGSYDKDDFTGGYRRLERLATALVTDIPQFILQAIFYFGGFSNLSFEMWLLSALTSFADFTQTLYRMRREMSRIRMGFFSYVVHIFTDLHTGFYFWPLAESSPPRTYDDDYDGLPYLPRDQLLMPLSICSALILMIGLVILGLWFTGAILEIRMDQEQLDALDAIKRISCNEENFRVSGPKQFC
jgi:hypothetical protein